jgi:3-oxoacyl-[acyl-carrier protein] reductase
MDKQVVLITGSSRGIGKAAAVEFAKRGFRVVIHGNHSVKELMELREYLEKEIGAEVLMQCGDISDSSFVKTMFQTIEKTFGSVDVLVNNAGISQIGLFQDMTEEEWDRMLATNLSSIFYCCKQAVNGMLQKGSGRIINVSSMWGSCGASCEVAYSATKGGVNAFTKALAKELAPSHISVNAIAFGVIDTEMNGHLDEEERRSLEEEIPFGRFANAKEAGSFICHVAEADLYLTGQIIGFDGGFL